MKRNLVVALLTALAVTAAGCSLGPRTNPRDRLDYHEALSNSWKTRALLNVVRLRYADPPVFLDTAAIVNSYSWEAGANVGATFGPNVDEENSLGARGTYSNARRSPSIRAWGTSSPRAS